MSSLAFAVTYCWLRLAAGSCSVIPESGDYVDDPYPSLISQLLDFPILVRNCTDEDSGPLPVCTPLPYCELKPVFG